MIHRENMILYNVLNQEVIFEEYFCNLLQISRFKDLFLDFLNENNHSFDKEVIQYKHFNTEINLDNDFGRADLFLKFQNQEFIFEIKNKNNTSLTDNQPSNYLKHLKHKNSHLFFLIPKGYKHEGEIYSRWKDFDNTSNQILYWEDFIYKIKQIKLYKDFPEIKLFYDFCLYWFNLKSIIFSKSEQNLFKTKGVNMNNFTNKSIPTLIQKLEATIVRIGINSNMKKDNNADGYNYSKKIKDKDYTIYFGIDYEVWEDTGVPLNILIQNHNNGYKYFELELDNIILKEVKYKQNCTSDDAYFSYLVLIKDTLGSDSYQKTIIDQIRKLTDALKKL